MEYCLKEGQHPDDQPHTERLGGQRLLCDQGGCRGDVFGFLRGEQKTLERKKKKDSVGWLRNLEKDVNVFMDREACLD